MAGGTVVRAAVNARQSNTAGQSNTTGPPLWARIGHIAGWLLILAALAALGNEVGLAVEHGTYQPIAAGELWYRLDVTSLNLVQAITQRYLHPALWDPGIAGILQWPAWSLLGAPGAALIIAFPWRRGA
jgi:hypothetical protein